MTLQYWGSGNFQYAPITAEPAVIKEGRKSEEYEYEETRNIVRLVNEGADLIHVKGEAALNEFGVEGSRWCKGETYIFVLDPEGNMLVHPDPELKGKNQLDLKDINGKPIIRGLIDAVTTFPQKQEGWYHYEWPVPGGLLPRWKSSYVQLVKAPSGKTYIVGSGIYNDRMEREFIVDALNDAIGRIEKNKEEAFLLFHDPTGPFLDKGSYIFVIEENGVELVNPTFPNLEGRNILDARDAKGKYQVREMLDLVKTKGSGWVDYMLPKPGESLSTQKTSYVKKLIVEGKWLLVGCAAYLPDAPKETLKVKKLTAQQLMSLVREAAKVFEERGEKAFPEFRTKGTKWFSEDTYFFARSEEGNLALHAGEPSNEGTNLDESKDILGRPYGKMIKEVGESSRGEGWVHYLYPIPGNIYPAWKSSFIRRVTFPSGKNYIIGSGIYNMDMDKTFIEDIVNRAVVLVGNRGRDAFAMLRDKTGPFTFMDTYVFVDTADGIEVVNPAQPSIEGKKVIDLKDVRGKLAARDYINAALQKGSEWVDYYWYRPGDNQPAHKFTYVKKVKFGDEIFIIGSGYYVQ